MKKNGSAVPEILQIKGYKYRAQMLIGGVIILIILLLIIIGIFHGIASLFKGKDKSSDIDTMTDTTVSDSVQSVPVIVNSAVVQSTPQPETDTNTDTQTESKAYKFDADDKLIIDTDTLDGKKAVALTFDDGPGEYTERLITGLNERGVKATFFMCGECVSKYPNAVNMMVEGGHQIGNHTNNHTDITGISIQEMNSQIQMTDDAISNACGHVSTAFRPPYGSHSASTDAAITDKTIALWSLDSLDWQSRDAEAVRDVVVNNVWDGDIILLHDIYDTTVDGALMIVDELQSQGYVFVTVDELLTRYGYPIERGAAHNSQFAVYETNSPHAAEYQAEIDERIRKEEEARAASEAAAAFYDSDSEKTNSDTANASSDTASVTSETAYYNEEEY